MKLNLLIILIYLFPSTIHAQDFNTNYHPLACEYPENAAMSPSMIANYMLFYGSFDFSFLQRSTEGDVFHIGYQDYDRTA